MVILLCSRLKLGRDPTELVLGLTSLAFEMQNLGLSVTLAYTDQVQLLRQQINLVLLLRSQLVMRLLNKLELLSDDDQLTFLLLSLLLQSRGLVRSRLEFCTGRRMLRGQQLVLLPEVLKAALELIDTVR